MRKNKVKILSMLLITLSIISTGINAYAHSGRTDSSGGHKDNKNKSGLGSYHYHCGGYPAHLHTNGICPYSSSSSSSKSSTSNSSSSVTKTTSIIPTTIVATGIKIDKSVTSMKEGETLKLTASITPDNVTDKKIIWESSNDSIATIDSNGEIIAKKSGIVEITASTSNGKTNTREITIKKEQEIENEEVIMTSAIIRNNIDSNSTIKNEEVDSNPLPGIIGIGLIGGGSYLGYKKYKKS